MIQRQITKSINALKDKFPVIVLTGLSMTTVFSQNDCENLKNLIAQYDYSGFNTRATNLHFDGRDTTKTVVETDSRGQRHEFEWRKGRVQEKIITELRTYHLWDNEFRNYFGYPFNGWSLAICYKKW